MAEKKDTCGECGQEIVVQIFKGSGLCSVDCRKAQGIDHAPQGNLVFLTREEELLIKEARGG